MQKYHVLPCDVQILALTEERKTLHGIGKSLTSDKGGTRIISFKQIYNMIS